MEQQQEFIRWCYKSTSISIIYHFYLNKLLLLQVERPGYIYIVSPFRDADGGALREVLQTQRSLENREQSAAVMLQA